MILTGRTLDGEEPGEGHLRQSMRIGRLPASLVIDTDERKRRVGAFLEKAAARRQ